MRILLLAPQPFYSERGTPIAVDFVLRGLSDRGDEVDVLTYHLGEEVDYPGVRIFRTPKLSFIRDIRAGFSWKKLVCDLFMYVQAFWMCMRRRYHAVHAVEEAVFIALLLKWLFKIPYIYDMDSSLTQQMIDRYPVLFNPLKPLLKRVEGLAIREAVSVVPVCEALQDEIQPFEPRKVLVLHDVSLLDSNQTPEKEDLRRQLNIRGPLIMYVGNLEPYQGIDLLLESFALLPKKNTVAHLVIIGGSEAEISKYRRMADRLKLGKTVHFLGPKPVNRLSSYLKQADVLVSPRVNGSNTPMKIYSYLDSGKALLATRLPTHTQVLDSNVAYLADPNPRVFSLGVLRLLQDRRLRRRLGRRGKKLIQERHSPEVFRDRLYTLYDWLVTELDEERASGESSSLPGHFQRP